MNNFEKLREFNLRDGDGLRIAVPNAFALLNSFLFNLYGESCVFVTDSNYIRSKQILKLAFHTANEGLELELMQGEHGKIITTSLNWQASPEVVKNKQYLLRHGFVEKLERWLAEEAT